MGDDTVNVVTQNRPRFWAWANWSRQSEAEHPHRRPLMLAQEIARMPPGDQVILRAGMLPMRTQRCQWFSDPNFASLVSPPPPVPRLAVTVAADDGRTRVLAGARTSPADITAADVRSEPVESAGVDD